MAQMKDAEGEQLPPDNDGRETWDLGLYGDGALLLGVPLSMDVPLDNGCVFEFTSAGCLQINLRDVLQEYLDDHEILDGGDGLKKLSALLREFADKFDAVP